MIVSAVHASVVAIVAIYKGLGPRMKSHSKRIAEVAQLQTTGITIRTPERPNGLLGNDQSFFLCDPDENIMEINSGSPK